MRTLNVHFLRRRTRGTAVAITMLWACTVACGGLAMAQEDPPEPPETESVQIVNFTAQLLVNDVWVFSGKVTGGPTLGGLDVQFDGILSGSSTTTNSIGEFYFEKDLAGENGTAVAVAYSVDAIPSDPALTEAG